MQNQWLPDKWGIERNESTIHQCNADDIYENMADNVAHHQVHIQPCIYHIYKTCCINISYKFANRAIQLKKAKGIQNNSCKRRNYDTSHQGD